MNEEADLLEELHTFLQRHHSIAIAQFGTEWIQLSAQHYNILIESKTHPLVFAVARQANSHYPLTERADEMRRQVQQLWQLVQRRRRLAALLPRKPKNLLTS